MKADRKSKVNKKALRRAFRLFIYLKPHRLEFGVGLLFLLFSSLASLAFPKYLGELVDASAANLVANINYVAKILLLILVAQSVFGYFRIVLFVRVTEKMLASLRRATYEHLIQLPMPFFNKQRVGELTSRISADVSLLQETFTTTLAEFLRQLIIIVGGITLLTMTSAKLTLFMLAILPAVMIIAVVFGRFIRGYSKKVQDHVAESTTLVEESLQGIQTVKAFTNERLAINRYTDITETIAQTAIKGGKYRGAFASFIIAGLFGAIVAVIWRGSLLVQAGELEIGQLFSFVLYSGFIGGSIGGLADVYAKIQKAIGATESLLNILDEPIEPLESPVPAAAADTSSSASTRETAETLETQSVRGDIELNGVTFAYPSRPDMQVLSDVSLQIKAGEQVALVGASGAGKSTLVALILRLYHPNSGSLKLDGTAYDQWNLHVLRKNMALVPQEVLLFGGSIAENIGYGKPGASHDEIVAAAKEANAHEFITQFPDGYDTFVGERGVQLSGGQKQRVAIARAILKNPAILLLDEATSALDTESENLVQEALERLLKDRTSIVIAHRLSTLRSADWIVVMEEGQIVEMGTPGELSAREDSKYKQMLRLQNLGAN